jgi:CelD/BcsL family acetyltransferase involved in cellulose biosynthesis
VPRSRCAPSSPQGELRHDALRATDHSNVVATIIRQPSAIPFPDSFPFAVSPTKIAPPVLCTKSLAQGSRSMSASFPTPAGAASAELCDRTLDVALVPIDDVASLEPIWREVAARADHSFFLSWPWIGTWLRHLPEGTAPHLLTAMFCGRIVGLAVVCRRRAWPLALRPRSRWLLNESGDARFDRLFIEYNSVLADRALAERVVAACMEAMMTTMKRADRLVLSGIEEQTEATARRAAARAGLAVAIKQAESASWIDFAEIGPDGYRTSLGRNTRQALNRAMRLYAERGAVRHLVMETPQEALAAFDVMAALHQQRWGRAGAFANPGFRPFHEDLIARGVAEGIIRISRTLVGDETIGVLYDFVHDGLVLNYQSGFLYENDNRLKPGLVSFVLAVEDAIERGERGYDFMAGAAGHKNRLGNAERPLNWLVVGNDTLESRIETTAVQTVQMLARWRRRGRTNVTEAN